MGHTGCEEFLWWFCDRQERDPEFRARMMEALKSPIDPLRSVGRVIRETDPVKGAKAESELRELPEFAVNTLLGAWLEATSRGLGFSASAGSTDRPMDFARHRRVRVTVDEDEDSIGVQLTHIPRRPNRPVSQVLSDPAQVRGRQHSRRCLRFLPRAISVRA
ncbi:MAG: hypothetical protein AB7J35_04940 [Dehalococcoidia bacterium]